MTTPTACRSCTVSTHDADGICSFCKTYEPPTEVGRLLAGAHGHARQAAEDTQDAIDTLGLAATVPAVADVIAAHTHLIAAQRLLDRAAEQITAQVVTR